MSNWRDWIYVIPERPACGWDSVYRQVRKSFYRVAVLRGLLLAREKEQWANAGVAREEPAKRVRECRNVRMIELARRRDEADQLMEGAGRMTVAQLSARFQSFSKGFWREYVVHGVKRGVLVVHPARKAKEDEYEWKRKDKEGSG